MSIGVPGNALSEGTVCFSKDGSYYAAQGMFLDRGGGELIGTEDGEEMSEPGDGQPTVIEEIYICQAEEAYPSCSLGAGQKNFEEFSNVLKIVQGNQGKMETDSVKILETNVDDVSGEILGYVIEKIKRGRASIS